MLIAVVPAAGVGKRMQAHCPKQYLTFLGKTVLEHTVEHLLTHPKIIRVIIALGANDEYFPQLSLANNPQVSTVVGGKERVDSVLAGIKSINMDEFSWVLVHDAARPCVSHDDISKLISNCLSTQIGGLLATPVRDTMKRSQIKNSLNKVSDLVQCTESRENLWHALTPQMYKVNELISAIENALKKELTITDESSAIELANLPSQLIEASSDNIKITRPDDLALAEFIVMKQQQ
jgi:2-C-methyl-D-erythritol 4-phosphate cytidylyltransferase